MTFEWCICSSVFWCFQGLQKGNTLLKWIKWCLDVVVVIVNNFLDFQFLFIFLVSTFVTEDGQTGQIIISSNGHYPANLNASITNGLPLSDNEITNSAEDQVMPLPEETIEEIAGKVTYFFYFPFVLAYLENGTDIVERNSL